MKGNGGRERVRMGPFDTTRQAFELISRFDSPTFGLVLVPFAIVLAVWWMVRGIPVDQIRSTAPGSDVPDDPLNPWPYAPGRRRRVK